MKDFEWIVVGNQTALGDLSSLLDNKHYFFVSEPKKESHHYYRLNGAWNAAFSRASGDLILSLVDGLWFPPDTLEKLWIHYQNNPKSCITCVGHQYDQIDNGKPEHMVWRDPRCRTDLGSFYEVSPREMELCIASIPKKGIFEVGGVDEVFDQYAALSEKELCYRLDQIGYTFWIDQSIEYRAIHHPRISTDWDERYFKGCQYFDQCLKEISDKTRLKLDFLSN